MKGVVIAILIFLIGVQNFSFVSDPIMKKREKLSEYDFFQGPLASLDPAQGVIPYSVNTPLFSNYAEKLRFVRLPANTSADFRDSAEFDFPVGTVLIKNFYYPADFRNPDGERMIIETRLLVHQPKGWDAWPYVWNDEQTEAFYDPAGETKTISYVAKNGKKKTITYAVPNKNQCKGCHAKKEAMVPIGLTARQLNGDFNYKTGRSNQLIYWTEQKLLSGIHEPSQIAALPVWDDPATGSLDQRARAYLDANCGHCHSATGPASTSGLFLDVFENRPTHIGVNKTPVAAGRGAGNLKYDIVPGKPEQSILVYRMKTNDPAIAMPEIGREQVHEEGVALIEEWIRKNPF
jgi:uncharacterized repeat protein (TIGR03806 family)